jgi:hypothetical protein
MRKKIGILCFMTLAFLAQGQNSLRTHVTILGSGEFMGVNPEFMDAADPKGSVKLAFPRAPEPQEFSQVQLFGRPAWKLDFDLAKGLEKHSYLFHFDNRRIRQIDFTITFPISGAQSWDSAFQKVSSALVNIAFEAKDFPIIRQDKYLYGRLGNTRNVEAQTQITEDSVIMIISAQY